MKNKSAIMALLVCALLSAEAAARPADENHRATPNPSEQHCLARAIYFESRGLSVQSREAVAHVVLNRVGVRGNTACAVISDRIGGRPQFDFMRNPRAPRDQKQWSEAMEIAERMITARPHDFTRGATHFFNPRIAKPRTPAWATPDRIRWRDGHHVFAQVPMAPAAGVRAVVAQ